ncbi:hypothetical protein MLD38_003359 [Melastoma candidum]|uniref:Uncharacterized protein n=1 Tax=Melastoma candidum TaxID=119954 RepID=A0ACB9S1Z6_9MYRT|nr:hypothetical protein MLD38_003359 [Melastoma candidum]
MGKLLCDSASAAADPVAAAFLPSTSPWAHPHGEGSLDSIPAATSTSWDRVPGLEDQQRSHLKRLCSKGVLWKNPREKESEPVVFLLGHGGEVSADGNCLFTAVGRGVGVEPRELRRRVIRTFEGGVGEDERAAVEGVIRNMYAPDVGKGWGVHVVQEVKLLAPKKERDWLDKGIDELVQLGMQREMAAESIYKERCIPVNDVSGWAKYMSISGSPSDEYDIITLQYTEEGLLSIDENRDGHAAAFGDDIAIECLATEFKREIFVVQAHGADAMVDDENCLFFLPHPPRSEICGPPLFLFMKGTGWCGAGADHYEPLIAQPTVLVSPEKVAIVL